MKWSCTYTDHMDSETMRVHNWLEEENNRIGRTQAYWDRLCQLHGQGPDGNREAMLKIMQLVLAGEVTL